VKILQQKLPYVQTLPQLGDTWEVKDGVIDKLESFTCCVYGRPRFSKVSNLRYPMLEEKCGDEVFLRSQRPLSIVITLAPKFTVLSWMQVKLKIKFYTTAYF